jgi:predicted nucleotidyltransferase
MFKKLNILKIFFEEPSREFNVREIARILKIAPATASKELKEELVKQSILKERKQKIFNLYKANLESDFYRDLKIYYNLRKIKDSGLLEALNKFYLKPTIVLFGSAASGLDTETSDFDLLVISEKIKEFPESKKFEKKLNRKLQIFVVKNIKELKNKHLINNIVNGITLQGKIKWI